MMPPSLHVPTMSMTTPNKKPSVSTNKPNCNSSSEQEVFKTPKNPAKKIQETPKNRNDDANETTVETTAVVEDISAQKEATPDIIIGSVEVKSSSLDSMEPQVMEENAEESNDVMQTNKDAPTIDSSNATEKDSKGNDHVENNECEENHADGISSQDNNTPSKPAITSEAEAKARLAEKRRQMKEKMERDAELERQRQV